MTNIIAIHAQYVDDIRVELGNRLSLMGQHKAVMSVDPKFPLIIPRIAVVINIIWNKKGSQMFDKLMAHVDMPIGTSAEFSLPWPPPHDERDPSTNLVSQGYFSFFNVPVAVGKVFKTTVKSGRKSWDAGSLLVIQGS